MNISFWKEKQILITGGHGFIGGRLVSYLTNYRKVSPKNIRSIDHKQYDLRELPDVTEAIKGIDVVIHLAADIGGIAYSQAYPATQFRNCSLIDLQVFEAAAKAKISKFVAVSSSVGYPVNTRSPLVEDQFFDGLPAESAYGYSFAKRNTAVLAQIYARERGLPAIVVVPNNAYGPGQEINLDHGHVISSLIYKCLTQKTLEVWGDGKQVRDFLYVDDLVEGILLAAEFKYDKEPLLINLGTGKGTSIRQLTQLVIELTGFRDKVHFDAKAPSGQKERIVDITRAKKLLGFFPRWTLRDGLKETVSWVKKQIK